MTKRELRMRVLAVARGAGMIPSVLDDTWGDVAPTSMQRFLTGIRGEFDLPLDNAALCYWNIDEYETPSSAVDFLWRVIGDTQ